jgi:hypothetical protein
MEEVVTVLTTYALTKTQGRQMLRTASDADTTAPCLDFARQLFKLGNKNGVSGESMAIEAKVLVDK